MKIGALPIIYIKRRFERFIAHAHKGFEVDKHLKIKFNVPYIDDGNDYHKIDIYYAEKRKKNRCIIDIHGGAYLFGNRLNNYHLAKFFVDRGYDVVTLDYIPNKKKRGTFDIVNDVAAALEYIYIHLKELELENDDFVMCGDSAGGHLALLFTEMINDDKYRRSVTPRQFALPVKALLLNCPVYDYLHLGEDVLLKSGQRYMFGPHYNDKEERALIDPRSHIDCLSTPLFLSTCRNDFIRKESLALHDDLVNKNYEHTFIDIDSSNKKVGHVHNIMYMELDESKIINNAMVDFINSIK